MISGTPSTPGASGGPANDKAMSLAAMAAGLGGFVLLQVVAWLRAGGVFEYPLDDVYIHLAIGEQVAKGGYGVNPGEPASAGSSPLYPFLLAPLAGSPLHRFLPLALNLAGLAVACWIWGRIVARAGFGPRTGLALAVLGPLGLNMAGVAFLGMEHGLHAAASLAVLLGLQRFLDEGRIDPIFVAGVVLAPALRLEGLALSGAALLVVLIAGRWRAALVMGTLAATPVAGFMAFLAQNGLEPVPNSVSAKLVATSTLAHLSWLEATLAGLVYNVMCLPGAVLAAVAAAAGWAGRRAGGSWRVMSSALILAIVAHLAFGQMNWANRYEHYIVVAALAGLILILGRAAPGRWWSAGVPLSAIVVLGGYYNSDVLTDGTASPRALHLQQAQMARFVRTELKQPVAVNDLGRVSYANPHYVLDLWGLASPEALATRLSSPARGWAGPLTAEHGVRVAMIYDPWLRRAVGETWVKLGKLRLDGVSKGFIAEQAVTFYATTPKAAREVAPSLEDFAADLPEGATFSWSEFTGAGGLGS